MGSSEGGNVELFRAEPARRAIAWREMTNLDIAARIVGFIRQRSHLVCGLKGLPASGINHGIYR